MATFTNKTKNAIFPDNKAKSIVVFWDDTVATWDSSLAFWDSPYYKTANLAKNAITPTNLVKN